MQAFISTNVIITLESRSCAMHFENGDIKSRLYYAAITHIVKFSDNVSLNAKQITDLFQILIKENQFSNIGDRFNDITRIGREDFLVKR